MRNLDELFTKEQKELLDLLADGKTLGEIATRFKLNGYGDFNATQMQNKVEEIMSLAGVKTVYYLAVLTERKKWLEQIEKTITATKKETWQEGFAEGWPRGIWRGVFYGVVAASIAFGIYIYFSN